MSRRPLTTPVCLYVLWHPSCETGEALATSIYDWFHAPSGELHRAGLGLPVYYRSAPADSRHLLPESVRRKPCKGDDSEVTSRPAAPPPIGVHDAALNLIVVLADQHLVSDPIWRRYVVELANIDMSSKHTDAPSIAVSAPEYVKPDNEVQIYTVPLHGSAYRLPSPVGRNNYLRVDSNSTEAIKESLRRQLTEVIGRKLFNSLKCRRDGDESNTGSDTNAPLTIFLSHAKRDGQTVAEALRDRITSYGQIKSFYDENDLPIGNPFGDLLMQEARGQTTAAMLSVVTDAYAGRPWCRAEITEARTPRIDIGNGHTGDSDSKRNRCWTIQPVIAVDALHKHRTRGVPELGSSPVIRWREGAEDEILDLMMLEVLLQTNHQLRAREIPYKEGREVITWVPDLSTVIAVLHQINKTRATRKARGAEPVTSQIVYPGHGLTPAELATYNEYFNGDPGLITYEQATREQ